MRHRNYIKLNLTRRQEQIIIGTILGGSSLVMSGKTPHLMMRDRDEVWLRYKANELESLSTSNSLTIGPTCRWHSISHPGLIPFYQKFYIDKQRALDIAAFELLYDTALAVWFKDCGYITKGNVVFNTNIWGETGTEVCVEYFNVISYNTTIIKQRGNYRIHLDDRSSEKFLKMIDPCFPNL